MTGAVFDVDAFVQQCKDALPEVDPQGAMREVVERSVRLGTRLADAVPEGVRDVGGLVHYSPELTVLWLEWPPGMYDPPHNHCSWATVGVFAGQEASTLYHCAAEGRVDAAGEASLLAGEVVLLPADAIHSVINPLSTWTGAIHVYGGDFLSPERREWDPHTLEQRAWDPGVSLERYRAAVAAASHEERISRGAAGPRE